MNKMDQMIRQFMKVIAGKYGRVQEMFNGIGRPNDARKILRAGSTLVLVRTAVNNGIRMQRGPDEESARSFWAVQFMGAKRDQVGVKLVNVRERLFTKGLQSIRVEKDAARTANLPKLSHRLNRPHFVIGRHEGNQDRVGPDRLLQIVGRDETFRTGG